MITRKVDSEDASPAAATYKLIEKLARQVDELKVICLEKGNVSGLGNNIQVESLGKEKGYGRIRELIRFKILAWRFIKQVDGVFCHQNPEYTILISPYTKLFRKRIITWYTHGTVNWKLHLVNLLTNKILTASEESCRLKNRKKIEITGHGIDVTRFIKGVVPSEKSFKIISPGRISPTKDLKTLVRAIDVLVNKKGINDIEVRIVGPAVLKQDEKYRDELDSMIKDKGLVKYVSLSETSYDAMPAEYQSADLMINLSQTGSVDKVVLEAMACEDLVLTSNEAFENILKDQKLMFEPRNYQELADKIIALMNLSNEEKQRIGQSLRDIVVENHNIDDLVKKIVNQFK